MIVSVRSNKPSFKEVKFTDGFNIVLADRTHESTKKDTRNGLGKSTLIEIIHFCLGSDISKTSLKNESLSGWSFALELQINNKNFSISRSVDSPNKVEIEGDISNWPVKQRKKRKTGNLELTVRDLNDLLGNLMFGLSRDEEKARYKPSFRGLISYFVRKGQDAYLTPFEHHGKQREVDKQVYNAFLLGLEWKYASEWQELKDKKKILETLQKAAKVGIIEEVLGSLGELETRRVRLEASLQKEEAHLKTFRVHPKFQEIEAQANDLTRDLHNLENEIISDTNLLDYYKKSIQDEKPPMPADILEIYTQAGIELPGAVKQRFEDVNKFHLKLIENRRNFLDSEINRMGRAIELRREIIHKKSDERSELMMILQTHGALEEYTHLQQFHMKTVSDLNAIVQRINDLKKIDQDKSSLAIEQQLLFQRARHDLDERHDQTNRAINLFNSNSEALYNVPGNLVIDVRPNGYEFKVEIERSDSHGIGNMKIFCYDLMLAQLWANQSRSPKFLIHDSTIFDGVDERQRAFALELAHRESQKNGFQYICTLNSDMIPSNEFSPGFNFDEFVKLRLTDRTDNGCLLGIRF